MLRWKSVFRMLKKGIDVLVAITSVKLYSCLIPAYTDVPCLFSGLPTYLHTFNRLAVDSSIKIYVSGIFFQVMD